MQTKVLLPTKENIEYAAKLLKDGEICAIPTETVYGLAANALNKNAVAKIFAAKGRPQDNPLIVHINNLSMLDSLVKSVPETAKKLAEKFWPGPLTMIFKKSDIIPTCVTAGMDTVAIRFPSHPVAQQIIEAAKLPLAAPSANLSGKPSPTKADHVFSDLNGKIPAIIDGGSCEFGLESTVVLINDDDSITLLRPGAVTLNKLHSVVPDVKIGKGVLEQVSEDEAVLSPGLKHKHYSPNTNVLIIDSDFDSFKSFVELHKSENIGAMVFDGEQNDLSVPCVTYGKIDDEMLQAKLLFSALRRADEMGVDTVYARMPKKDGIGLAIYNRLIRAAGFEVIKL